MAKQTREISLETLDFLCSAHPAMNALIRHTGTLRYEISPPFEALVESVVGQQISGKAADAIRQRMADALGPPTPRALAGADGDTLRGCGLSGPKVRYIQGIAQAALSGAVDFEGLKRLPDEDVVKQLVTLPGVGRWTAEMLLLFSLDRPDVLSFTDLGIRRGLMRLSGLDSLDRKTFDWWRDLFSPFGSAASLYLWRGRWPAD